MEGSGKRTITPYAPFAAEIREFGCRSTAGSYWPVHLGNESLSSVGESPPANHSHRYHTNSWQKDGICRVRDLLSESEKQRQNIGSLAQRSTRGRSQKARRKSKVIKSMCLMFVSLSRNPVRKAPYEAQIKHYNLPVKRRQLRRKLKEYTKEASCTNVHLLRKRSQTKT
jgi:hypothetical protein